MSSTYATVRDTVRRLFATVRFSRAVATHRRQSPPGCVYHYTSAAGLNGIVTQRALRATNYSFLNDPTELAYGRSVVQRILAQEGPLLKSPAYRAEREWRVVLLSSADQLTTLEFDTSKGSIRPYIMLPFAADEPLPIASLRVMAPNRPEPALKAAGLLLRKSGSMVTPLHSEVPFAE
jgi:hypothetical protein